MSLIEILAVTFSLLSVILTVKNNIFCWPVGILGSIFYMYLFLQGNIYGNSLLQVVFIGQSVLGWYNWGNPSKYPIRWIDRNSLPTVILTSILLIIIISMTISENGGKMPLLDGITTSLSIMGIVLVSYRKIDSWIFWIITDLFFIYFFYINGLFLSSIIYFIFLILAIIGLFSWIKKVNTYEEV